MSEPDIQVPSVYRKKMNALFARVLTKSHTYSPFATIKAVNHDDSRHLGYDLNTYLVFSYCNHVIAFGLNL